MKGDVDKLSREIEGK